MLKADRTRQPSHNMHGRDQKCLQNVCRETKRENLVRKLWYIRVNDNKIDLKEIRLESRDWTHLGRERDQQQMLVNTVMNLWPP
jgi:hypothetical protein